MASTRAKRLLFGLSLAVLTGSLLEAGSICALRGLKAVRGIEYCPLPDGLTPSAQQTAEELLATDGVAGLYLGWDSELGWTVNPNARADRNGIEYRSNAAASRSDRELPIQPPEGVLRISAFGDSFVHCLDVVEPCSWERALERLSPGTEVMNFGVPGYGVDQAYLRYLGVGRRYHPGIVLIGIMSENIYRHVNVYRPFYVNLPQLRSNTPTNYDLAFGKPRFLASNGANLTLLPNPLSTVRSYRELLERPSTVLRRIGANDYFYQAVPHAAPWDASATVRLLKLGWYTLAHGREIVDGDRYNPNSEAYAVTRGLLELFAKSVKEDGATPVLVFFPRNQEIDSDLALYRGLIDELRAQGYRCVDVLEGFHNLAPELKAKDVMLTGHYGSLGNHVAAEWLDRCLGEWLGRKRPRRSRKPIDWSAFPDSGELGAADRQRILFEQAEGDREPGQLNWPPRSSLTSKR